MLHGPCVDFYHESRCHNVISKARCALMAGLVSGRLALSERYLGMAVIA